MSTTVKSLLLIGTHMSAVGVGFAVGIYLLPILTAPESPDIEAVRFAADNAQFTGEFRRDLADSDAFHWGEGNLFISRETISFEGRPAISADLDLSPFGMREYGYQRGDQCRRLEDQEG